MMNNPRVAVVLTHQTQFVSKNFTRSFVIWHGHAPLARQLNLLSLGVLPIQIIEQRTNEHFEPEKYTDEIRSRILELIEQKVEGKEISVPPEERPEAKIIDLMEALKASVAGASTGARPRKPAQRATKKPESTKKSTKRKSG